MQKCEQMAQTEFTMESSSSTKKYRVRAFLPDAEPPTCDCVAFAISRNRDGGKNHGGAGWCKHIKKVLDETCTWQEGAEDQTVPGVCPRCFGPTTDAAPTVIPEDKDKAAEVVTAKLLDLVKSLEG